MIQVKIKKASIRENPKAGKTNFDVPGRCSTEVIIRNYTKLSESPDEIILSIASEDDVFVKTKRQIHTVYHQPESKYLYEYEPCPVKCKYCGWEGDVKELEYDAVGDDYSNQVCPQCGNFECTRDTIIYETIDGFLNKQKTVYGVRLKDEKKGA